MKVTKLHTVNEFKQPPWLRENIWTNADQEAKLKSFIEKLLQKTKDLCFPWKNNGKSEKTFKSCFDREKSYTKNIRVTIEKKHCKTKLGIMGNSNYIQLAKKTFYFQNLCMQYSVY